MIGMFCFNTFADSFILLQTSDLSVSLITILIGHLLMAFVTEFVSVHTYKVFLNLR